MMYFIKKFIIGYFVKIWRFIFGRDPIKTPDDSIADSIPENLEAEGIHVSRGAWDKLIDGVNRLPRPIGTFGVYALLGTAVFSPDKYAAIMVSLSGTPYMIFVIYLTIIGFWFGGKIIQSYSTKKLLESMDTEVVLKRIRDSKTNQEIIKRLNKFEERFKNTKSPLSKEDIEEWNRINERTKNGTS